MEITKIDKVREGLYTIESLPCPKCKEVLSVEIEGSSLYKYHQGQHISEVMPNESLDVRERFITGYCPTCWDLLFPDEDEED